MASTDPNCPWQGMTTSEGESLACRGECKCGRAGVMAAYQYRANEADRKRNPKPWLDYRPERTGGPF